MYACNPKLTFSDFGAGTNVSNWHILKYSEQDSIEEKMGLYQNGIFNVNKTILLLIFRHSEQYSLYCSLKGYQKCTKNFDLVQHKLKYIAQTNIWNIFVPACQGCHFFLIFLIYEQEANFWQCWLILLFLFISAKQENFSEAKNCSFCTLDLCQEKYLSTC